MLRCGRVTSAADAALPVPTDALQPLSIPRLGGKNQDKPGKDLRGCNLDPSDTIPESWVALGIRIMAGLLRTAPAERREFPPLLLVLVAGV